MQTINDEQVAAIAAEITDPAMLRQWELEEEMVAIGLHRAQTQQRSNMEGGRASATPGGQVLSTIGINKVAAALDEFINNGRKGRTGPNMKAAVLLAGLDPKVTAAVAGKAVVDCATVQKTVTYTAMMLAKFVSWELRIRNFAKQNPSLLSSIERNFKTSNPEHRFKVLGTLAARHGLDIGENWTKSERLHVGIKLLELFVEVAGIVQIEETYSRGKSHRHVIFGVTAAQLIANRNDRAALSQPSRLPTLVAPKPWNSPVNGGYWFSSVLSYPLVGQRRKGYVEELENSDLSEVYSAVNALQDTRWSVNKKILDVMQVVAEHGTGLGKLPIPQAEPIPPKPHDIDTNDVARLAWRRSAAIVHEANTSRRSKGFALASTLAIAERFQDEEAIWFPYQLDFRGRAYPMPMFLQPQGNDYQKSLLQFAEGKPIGLQGAGWLAVMGAGLMGTDHYDGTKLDKLPFDDRIKWVEDNEEGILNVASDPFKYQAWTTADKPWMFLAFCFEWAGYLAEGVGFKSRLPVAMDGTCNGLQHFSAMLRDTVGGAAVNLVPGEEPSDIYEEVLKVCVSNIPAGTLSPVTMENLDRQMVKRPVMTMPYGARQYGFKDQIAAELKARGVDTEWSDITYLSGVIWDSIGEVVTGARQAMDWLQEVAAIAASSGHPIFWDTPCGLPVLQDYRTMRSYQVKTRVFGKIIRPRMQEETDKLDILRQKNGISPNFVHSLDASAMMDTVNISVANGISSFAMIHDSYGTHAADAATLATCLREAFIRTYEDHDVMQEFYQAVLNVLPEERHKEVPLPPAMGDLDLGLVRQSDFFFH